MISIPMIWDKKNLAKIVSFLQIYNFHARHRRTHIWNHGSNTYFHDSISVPYFLKISGNVNFFSSFSVIFFSKKKKQKRKSLILFISLFIYFFFFFPYRKLFFFDKQQKLIYFFPRSNHSCF